MFGEAREYRTPELERVDRFVFEHAADAGEIAAMADKIAGNQHGAVRGGGIGKVVGIGEKPGQQARGHFAIHGNAVVPEKIVEHFGGGTGRWDHQVMVAIALVGVVVVDIYHGGSARERGQVPGNAGVAQIARVKYRDHIRLLFLPHTRILLDGVRVREKTQPLRYRCNAKSGMGLAERTQVLAEGRDRANRVAVRVWVGDQHDMLGGIDGMVNLSSNSIHKIPISKFQIQNSKQNRMLKFLRIEFRYCFEFRYLTSKFASK